MRTFNRGWIGLSLCGLLWGPTAHAVLRFEPYHHPDTYNSHKQRILYLERLPQVNLNTASVSELQMLPNMSEDLALKIVQARPFQGLEDLRNLPTLSEGHAEQLMYRWESRVRF